jgi:DNA-binding CsgD family transcriptional regulator
MKPVDRQRLFAAIAQALSRDTAQRLHRASGHTIELRFNQLTRREREVLIRVVRGWLNKQIAWELGNGVEAIKVHRARVMHKMGARSVPELMRLAERVGMAVKPIPSAGARALAWRLPLTTHGQSDAIRVGCRDQGPMVDPLGRRLGLSTVHS